MPTPPGLQHAILHYGPHELQTVSVWVWTALQDSIAQNVGHWVIYIHAGGWRDPRNTANDFGPALALLAASHPPPPPGDGRRPEIAGFASINYRLSAHPGFPQPRESTAPNQLREARHPDHLNDVCAALSRLESVFRFGARYVLVGHSAGATLAFQVVTRALTARDRGREAKRPSRAKAGRRGRKSEREAAAAAAESDRSSSDADADEWESISGHSSDMDDSDMVYLAHEGSEEQTAAGEGGAEKAAVELSWVPAEGRIRELVAEPGVENLPRADTGPIRRDTEIEMGVWMRPFIRRSVSDGLGNAAAAMPSVQGGGGSATDLHGNDGTQIGSSIDLPQTSSGDRPPPTERQRQHRQQLNFTLPEGIIGIAGIYEFRDFNRRHSGQYTQMLRGAFGPDEAGWNSASPVCWDGPYSKWLDRRAVTLAWSPSDQLVDECEIVSMIQRLSRNGVIYLADRSLTGDHDVAWADGRQLARLVAETLERMRGARD